MRRDLPEKNGERCIIHHLIETFHGANLVLIHQGVLGCECKEALKLGSDDGFHLHIRLEDERTANSYALGHVR